jgi:hypothetical protein
VASRQILETRVLPVPQNQLALVFKNMVWTKFIQVENGFPGHQILETRKLAVGPSIVSLNTNKSLFVPPPPPPPFSSHRHRDTGRLRPYCRVLRRGNGFQKHCLVTNFPGPRTLSVA